MSVKKSAQVTLFIIIGVVLIASFFFIFGMVQKQESTDRKIIDSSLNLEPVKEYTNKCISIIVGEGLAKVGYKNTTYLEDYIDNNLLGCIDGFKGFPDMNIDISNPRANISISKDNQTLLVDINFPLIIEKGDTTSSIKMFELRFPINLIEELKLVDNILQKNVVLSSPDSRMQMEIAKGTIITNKDGIEFNEIWINLNDKKDYFIYEDNSLFNVIYEMLPNGAQFNPPLILTIEYDDELVQGINESTLTFSWYGNGKWTPYESIVDTENNIITAKVDHFTGGSVTTGESAGGSGAGTIRSTCGGLSETDCGNFPLADNGNKHCSWENNKCMPSCGVWLTDHGYDHGEGKGCINGGVPGFDTISCSETNNTCKVGEEVMTYLGLNVSNNTASNELHGTHSQTYSDGCHFCLEQGLGGSGGTDELDLSTVIWLGSDISGLPIVSGLKLTQINVGEAGINFEQSMLVDEEMGLVYFFWNAGGQWYGKPIEHIGAQRPWNVCRGLHYIGENADPGPIPDGWKVCPNSPWGHDGHMENAAVPKVGEQVYYLVKNENPAKQERTAVASFEVYVENKCGGGAVPTGPAASSAYTKSNLKFNIKEVGKTDSDGFMSMTVFNDTLYAGTYSLSGKVKIYSYPEWKEEENPNVGESIFDLEVFNESLYAIAEGNGELFRSRDGSAFTKAFQLTSHNLGLGLKTFDNRLYATFTNFKTAYDQDTKGDGPKLYVSENGKDFNKVPWPMDSRGECIIYDIEEFNDKLFTHLFCYDHSTAEIYESSNGKDWKLKEKVSGIKALGTRDGDGEKLYGYTIKGSTIKLVESSDITNTKDMVDLLEQPTGMIFYNDAIYILTSACWKCESSEFKAKLLRYGFDDKKLTFVHEFPELEARIAKVFNGSLYVGTKDTSKGGKMYKIDQVKNP